MDKEKGSNKKASNEEKDVSPFFPFLFVFFSFLLFCFFFSLLSYFFLSQKLWKDNLDEEDKPNNKDSTTEEEEEV